MIDDRLQDLIIPTQEMGINIELWLGLVLFSCLIALAIFRWQKKRKSSFAIAQNKLENLIQSYLQQQSQQADNKQQTALHLVSILCQSFSVNRLDEIQTKDDKAWAIYQKQLNIACYSANSNTDIETLLNEAKHWITQQ